MSQATPDGNLYRPANTTITSLPWNITLLSQRDAHLQIPVNFVTLPGVVIRAACFAHDRYESNAFITCLSNLLAGGFRHLVLDVYWDQHRRAWSLCPAEIPAQDSTPETATQTITEPRTTQRNALSGFLPGASSVATTSRATSTTTPANAQLPRRQVLETLSNPTASSNDAILTATVLPASATVVSSQSPITATRTFSTKESLYAMGPYTCSESVDFDLFVAVLGSYFAATDNTLQAAVNKIILNVHAAASYMSPMSPAPAVRPDNGPRAPFLLGAIVNSNYTIGWLYTPGQLAEQRASLKTSWLQTDNASVPDTSYFNLTSNGDSTPNGWPSESWLEFEQGWRVLLGFGNIDPQISSVYNFTSDSEYVFPREYLIDTPDVAYGPAEQITSGCFYNASTTLLQYTNSSFANSAQIPDTTLRDSSTGNAALPHPALSNLTACGISPMLNSTLFNRTADQDAQLYTSFALGSIWSWAPGEPLGDGAVSTTQPTPDASDFRCAVASAASNGRWHTAFCAAARRGACRADTTPYLWRLTAQRARYVDLENACPPGMRFAVPRTALENRYLLDAVRAAGEDAVFVNFNSQAVQYCWVEGVHNACPYLISNAEEAQVIVPTVAAVLVFVIALGLVLVKCGGNRREKRRARRKGEVNWDYEGVPS